MNLTVLIVVNQFSPRLGDNDDKSAN